MENKKNAPRVSIVKGNGEVISTTTTNKDGPIGRIFKLFKDKKIDSKHAAYLLTGEIRHAFICNIGTNGDKFSISDCKYFDEIFFEDTAYLLETGLKYGFTSELKQSVMTVVENGSDILSKTDYDFSTSHIVAGKVIDDIFL